MKQGSTGHGQSKNKPKKIWRLDGAGLIEFEGLCGQLIAEKRVGSFGIEKAFLSKIPFPVWSILIGQFIILATIETPDRKAFIYTALSPLFDSNSILKADQKVPYYKPHIELDDVNMTVSLTIEKVKQNKIIKP